MFGLSSEWINVSPAIITQRELVRLCRWSNSSYAHRSGLASPFFSIPTLLFKASWDESPRCRPPGDLHWNCTSRKLDLIIKDLSIFNDDDTLVMFYLPYHSINTLLTALLICTASLGFTPRYLDFCKNTEGEKRIALLTSVVSCSNLEETLPPK